jgi:hypothetical protein
MIASLELDAHGLTANSVTQRAQPTSNHSSSAGFILTAPSPTAHFPTLQQPMRHKTRAWTLQEQRPMAKKLSTGFPFLAVSETSARVPDVTLLILAMELALQAACPW